MRFLIFIFIALFFSACGEVSYPSWFVESEDDSVYLYGVGEGSSFKEAKLSAINDIATKISLKIESNTNINKQQKDSEFYSNVSNDIAVIVENISLDSVEYIENEKINNTFFTKARIKKSVLISKLNSDINADSVIIKGILSETQKTKCATMSPKDRYKIQTLFDDNKEKISQIKALNGKVDNESFLNNVEKIISISPSADYVSFARGGDSNIYQLIENALMSEYSKFFAIIPQDSNISHIENTIHVDKTSEHITIEISANVKDCNGNAIFSTNIESTKDSNKTDDTIARLKAQLFKKLDSWIKN